MIALLLAAAISRCASAELCPTDKQLLDALYARANDAAHEVGDQLRARSPGDVVLAEVRKISGVSDVHCGDALEDGVKAMNCSYQVHYGPRVIYEVAKLVWGEDGWRISDALSVSRKGQ